MQTQQPTLRQKLLASLLHNKMSRMKWHLTQHPWDRKCEERLIELHQLITS